MKNKLLIVTNVDWFLISHRLIIAQAAIKKGWEVYVACEDTGRSKEIEIDGIKFIPFSFSRSGTNLFTEISLLLRFYKLYKLLKPDVIHHITIKPVVYGTIAAKLLNVKGVVNAISGLGYMFVEGKIGIMQTAILQLMKYGSNRKNTDFIFQNLEDQNVLINSGVISNNNRIHLIKGSGVDLEMFNFTPLPDSDKIIILLPCRMLWDKGVKELREASEILKTHYKDRIQFVLLGSSDDNNKSSVPTSYLEEWQDGSYVIWEGYQNNVLDFYKKSHIVVLPSYREGLPKTLIEACAIGRAIITTNAIGCKDCVDEGVNGFKVPVKDSGMLAKAIEKLILNPDLIASMGVMGRKKAKIEFDVNTVISRHLEIYDNLLNQ